MGINDIVKAEFDSLYNAKDLKTTKELFQSHFDDLETDYRYNMSQVKIMAKTIKSIYGIDVEIHSQKLYRLFK